MQSPKCKALPFKERNKTNQLLHVKQNTHLKQKKKAGMSLPQWTPSANRKIDVADVHAF